MSEFCFSIFSITVTIGHELQELQILTLFYPCKENSSTVSIYFCFFIYDPNHFLYYPQMSVLSFHCFPLILVFQKGAKEIILTLPYLYKFQKFEKMNERKIQGHQSMAAEYVVEQINRLILQLDLRKFYYMIFAPSRKLQYAIV